MVSSVNVIVNVMPLQEYKSYNVARDTFLSHLGATLWGSMRHVVAPSIADGAYHYYDKISFQLYFITQDVSIRFIFFYLVFLLAAFFFNTGNIFTESEEYKEATCEPKGTYGWPFFSSGFFSKGHV